MANLRGFTIIELLVVLAIIGLLVAAASLSFGSAQRTGRDAQRMGDILAIAKAVDRSTIANGGIHPGKFLDMYGVQVVTESCANSLYKGIGTGATTTVTSIELSDFKNGAIPLDPLSQDDPNDPSHAANGFCVFPNYGYIYQSHYAPSVQSYPTQGSPACVQLQIINTCSMAIQLKVEYLLEFSLENQLPPDSQAFRKFTNSDLTGVSSTEKMSEAIGSQSQLNPKNNDSLVSPIRYVYYLAGEFCDNKCYTN